MTKVRWLPAVALGLCEVDLFVGHGDAAPHLDGETAGHGRAQP